MDEDQRNRIMQYIRDAQRNINKILDLNNQEKSPIAIAHETMNDISDIFTLYCRKAQEVKMLHKRIEELQKSIKAENVCRVCFVRLTKEE